ncbi:concanavalin A-like lectin/glucanase [Caudoviricetes sp.]|nr:concanavalin A-like lectin/glucanase [Caudoviricetes sp.]
MPIISVTLPSDNTTADVADYNLPITTILSTLNGGLDDDNIASLSGTKLVAGTVPQSAMSDASLNGWVTGKASAISSVTHNGNRSYTATHASSMDSVVQPGMKARFTRTTAAPTYMGGVFNGSSQYFIKTTPTSTLSTITNNFTIMLFHEPTSYVSEYLVARTDAAANNSIDLSMTSTGTVRIAIISGGSGNVRYIDSIQSLPLERKTHIAVTWSSGTVVMYFDGVSVPVASAVTSGTAPTSAGTGGDFAIGRRGASATGYAVGYISGVGIFNAVLSASTIRSYIPQVLSGAEANCIGAWSLNNTAVNQQSPGTNDLTATGSVGYTNISPYSVGASNTPSTYDYGVVTAVSGTSVTYQMCEGCTIPTSGGVSAVDISPSGNPIGFPMSKNRWRINTLIRADISTASNATFGAMTGVNILVPIGAWAVGWMSSIAVTAVINLYFNLSDETQTGLSETASDRRLQTHLLGTSGGASNSGDVNLRSSRNLSAATTFTMYSLGSTTTGRLSGVRALTELFAEFEYI